MKSGSVGVCGCFDIFDGGQSNAERLGKRGGFAMAEHWVALMINIKLGEECRVQVVAYCADCVRRALMSFGVRMSRNGNTLCVCVCSFGFKHLS